jgi:FMN phosphatase YigB (HAD superfamily)
MLSAAALLSRHPEAEVLCIDMFDTISTRSVAQPTHVFALMERELVSELGDNWHGFALRRVLAEDRARHAQLEIDDRADVTLQQIYSAYAVMCGLSHTEAHGLADLEIGYQLQVAQPVPFGVEIANLARERGMRVLIISDNYMSSTVIAQLANKVGLSWVTDDHVVVSCEHGGMKHNGWLWRTVLGKFGVDATKVLHVGDDPHADGVMPQSFGIKCEVRGHSRRSHRRPHNTCVDVLPHSVLEAEYRNRVMADTWDDVEAVGSTTVALVVARQIVHALEILEANPQARIYFAARDGWMAHQAWTRLRELGEELPDATFLSFSRNVVWRSRLTEVGQVEAAKFVGEDENLSPRQLGHRLNCEFSHAEPDVPLNSTVARELVVQHGLQVLDGARQTRDGFVKYLASTGILNPGHHVVFDLGWKGSAVADLADFVSSLTNGASTVEGIFTGLYWDASAQRTRLAMSSDSVDDLRGLDSNVQLLGMLRFIESLITAPMGSVVGFSDEGEPRLAHSEVETESWDRVVSRVAGCAISTATEIVRGTHRSGVSRDHVAAPVVWASLMQVGQSPRIEEVNAFAGIRHVTSIDHADSGHALVADAPEITADGIHPQWLGDVFNQLQKFHWLQGSLQMWMHQPEAREIALAIQRTWPALNPDWVSQ